MHGLLDNVNVVRGRGRISGSVVGRCAPRTLCREGGALAMAGRLLALLAESAPDATHPRIRTRILPFLTKLRNII